MSKKVSLIFTLALALLSPNASPAASLSHPLRSTAKAANPPITDTPQTLDPKSYNVVILSDERLLIMMAALNLAGYDYDPSGQPQGLRAKLREDLKNTSPELVTRLRNYYNSHRSQAREEIAQVSPYIGLALALGPLPSLSAPTVLDKLPPDVREVADFVPLLQEFYVRSGIKDLLPKYRTEALNSLKSEYEQTAGRVLYETLSYLHTQPVLLLPPTPIFIPDDETDRNLSSTSGDKSKQSKQDREQSRDQKRDKNSNDDKDKQGKYLSQPRTRRLLIFLNPFAPAGSVFERNDILNGTDDLPRRLGDDYCIVASAQSLTDHIRHGFLRFTLDPIVGKSSIEIANLKEKIDPLLAALPRAKDKARRNVYEVVGESLARAVGVRLTALASGGSFTKDDALYLLSQQYEQGAVLIFHFYDSLGDLERAGIDISAFVPAFLTKIDFAHEAKRLDEAAAARARVEQRQASVKSFIDVDTLINQRKYQQAQTQLEAILKEQPQNARALFGMAQIVNNQLSRIEADEQSADDDKIAAQEERLARAMKLYQQAIAAAGPQEQWLVSQCHVFIGHILDFVEQRDAAVAEYEKAIKLGDIPKGAFRDAVEGKAKPYAPTGR